jgi:hypothetical protein
MDKNVAIAIVANLKNLQKLIARGVGMTDEQAIIIAKGLPNIRELYITYNKLNEQTQQQVRTLLPRVKL